MDLLRVRRLFVGERVARFGIAGPGGHPRVTPVPFAVIDDGDDGVVVCTLDVRPRSIDVQSQIRRIAASPRVSLTVDHGLPGRSGWWARADGAAEVLRHGRGDPRFDMAARALVERYDRTIVGDCRTIVWTTVMRWSGWAVPQGAAA